MNQKLEDAIAIKEQERLDILCDILCEEEGSIEDLSEFIILDELKALRRLVRALIEADERGQGVQWTELMNELNRRVP